MSDIEELKAFEVFFVLEPDVLQRFLGSDSLGGVFTEHLLDEVLGQWRDAVPVARRVGDLAALVLLKNFIDVVSGEGRATREQHVQNYACAEDVGLAVVTFVFK